MGWSFFKLQVSLETIGSHLMNLGFEIWNSYCWHQLNMKPILLCNEEQVQADYQPCRPQDKTAQLSVIRYLTALVSIPNFPQYSIPVPTLVPRKERERKEAGIASAKFMEGERKKLVQADYQPRRPQDKTAQLSVIRYLTAL
ncbi:hypothetical protein Lal_00035310 [Lupinus albus]|nr:hypothetical protein Lal_00035310 [Lupinus albus]